MATSSNNIKASVCFFIAVILAMFADAVIPREFLSHYNFN